MKKPKKPKMPRKSASVQVWERYTQRVSDWKKRLNKIESDKKKKASLIEKARRA